MRLIAGLGNPGRHYRATPHNVGFEVIDCLAQRWKIKLKTSRKEKCVSGSGIRSSDEIILLKPLSYMNLSGEVVENVVHKCSLTPKDILILCDDVNLPIGRLRLRQRGTDGGHKGLRSIIQRLGTIDFARLRIGVAPRDEIIEDMTEYVLSPVIKKYRAVMGEMIVIAAECVGFVLDNGIDKAMAHYNSIDLIKK